MNLYELKNSRLVALACILFVLLVLAACGSSEDSAGLAPPLPEYSYSPPVSKADGWTVASAGSLGLSEEKLEAMMNSMSSDFDIVDSIAIAYQGELVLDETLRAAPDTFDGWVDNANPDMHVLFSVSKSIASIGIGIAIDQGLIEGVDTPYLGLFPYAAYDNWDERKNDIVLGDVLTMRLGLEWNEWNPPYTSPDNSVLRFYESQIDFSKALLDLPMASDPGTTFAYNTPSTVSLGQAIENSSSISLLDFGLANLVTPLDISEVEVLTTPTGLPDLGRGLYLLTRDLLKFGQLFLDQGQWNGRQIVSAAWADESTAPHVALHWTSPQNYDWKLDGYGYLWWTGYFEHNGQQLRSFAARGYGQQSLMVVPELELVIAIYSHDWNEDPGKVNQLYDLIARFVIPAVT